MGNRIHDLLGSARRFAGRVKRREQQKSRRRDISRQIKRSSILPEKNCADGTILFFSPEAGVPPHYAAQCVLARTLKEMGHKVLFARCFEVFERCPVMDMYQLPYAGGPEVTAGTCINCAAASIEMLDAYGLDSLDLRTLVTREIAAQYQRALMSLPDDLNLFEYDSIPFGKLCINDLVLATKILDFEKVSEEIRQAWLEYIKSSLLSYLLIDRLCQRFTISRIVHFNDYSVLLGARMAARKHGIPSSTVTLAPHNVIDRRRFLISSDIIWAILAKQERAWPAWRSLPLSADQVKAVAGDLLARLGGQGSHTYSPSKTFQADDIRSRLDLAKNRKLIVAYTSSLDEMLAGRALRESVGVPVIEPPQPFADQIAWLQELSSFVGARDDLQLVVRIHPREGANKRDSVSSMHLTRLRNAFGRPQKNCVFVWPAEPISSYDLGEAADVVLTSWSAIGLEMARLGVPVLTSTNGLMPFPHDDFLEWGQTATEYFSKLEMLLDRPTTMDTIARAFRWYNLFHLGTSLDLGDLVPTHDFEGLPVFHLPNEAAAIEEIIVKRKDILELNLERQIMSQDSASSEKENAAVERQLRRIIHFLFTGGDSHADVPLWLTESDETNEGESRVQVSFENGARTLKIKDSNVSYQSSGKTYERYSPMIVRLAKLCAQRGGVREGSAAVCI